MRERTCTPLAEREHRSIFFISNRAAASQQSVVVTETAFHPRPSSKKVIRYVEEKKMSTFRRTAREAVIFMLLGLVVGVLAAFALLQRGSAGNVKKDAAKAVYAYEATPLPPGYAPNGPANRVPLTNGVLLYVTDCDQAHPENAGVPVQRGSTNGVDCFYFGEGRWAEYMESPGDESLGSPVQVAIEKEYWVAYARSKHQHLLENGKWSLILGLWGFPAGLGIWLFYRLVRFAVNG